MRASSCRTDARPSGAKSDGRFGKQDFYLPEEDAYRCPAGEQLPYRFTSEEDGKRLRRYWTTACQDCSLKPQCTTGPERRIPRWEHEHLLEAVQQRASSASVLSPLTAAKATFALNAGECDQITIWKNQLLEGAAGVFGHDKTSAETPVDLKALHAKIGELALENDFLSGALTKAGLLSAKR
ncbi:hypothetical protein ABIF65_003530 [Bradyrhizobium japonicum]